MSNTQVATVKTETPAVDPITLAKSLVTVQGTERKRALRNAAIDAACESYGPFTLVERVNLKADEPKFSAWITGARGRNGWLLSLADGRKAVTGDTTVQDMIDRNAVTNPEMFAPAADAAVMVGILG